MYTYVATCLFGLEKLLGEEIDALGYKRIDNMDGRTTGAMGTTITYRVVLTNNPVDDVRYYHFILHDEHRSNGAPSDSFPRYISKPLKEVIVDAMTGECKLYEPPIYVEEDYGK